MSDHNQPSVGRELPAWLISVALHGLLLTLAVVVVGRQPRGAADEPGRQVGIVLKQSSADGEIYQREEAVVSQPSDADATSSATLAALPETEASDRFEQHLPDPLSNLQGFGSEQLTGDTAGEMTAGSSGQPANLAGGAATVSVFGVQGTGHKFVYAFDRSDSMNGAPLAAAKRQLMQGLNSLATTHQFQILFFNHNVSLFDINLGQPRIAFADDRNKQLAERFVSGIIADGGTDRYEALRKSLLLEPDVVFFLTDADDPMTPVEMQRIADLNRRVGATICTIEFGHGPKHGRQNFLVDLASMTGGQYGYVDTSRLSR